MRTIPETIALGQRHHRMGDLVQAARLYREVLGVDPAHVDALYLYGTACQGLGRVREAVAACEQVLRYRPEHPGAFNSLGVAMASQGRYGDAVDCYRRAVELKPEFAEACNNLGIALAQLGRIDEAVVAWKRALACKPDLADAHNNLGIAYKKQGKLEEAFACYERALALRPGFADAHVNMGNAFQSAGRLEEALRSFELAVCHRADHAEAHLNLGNVLHSLGRFDDALASYARAVAAVPDHALAHMNRGMTLLLTGRLTEGWAEYEWRWQTEGFPQNPFPEAPRWDGSDPAGKTVLLYAEQGLGDAIQFARYARVLERRGARVVVACAPPLLRLLRNATRGGEAVALGSRDALPPFDVHAPLMSLPALLGTTVASIPSDVPYLAVERNLVERWRRALGGMPGRRVGITWQGNPGHLDDRLRSIPLERFAPLAALEGIHLVSLQRGAGREQLRAAAHALPVLDLGARLEAECGDVLDTAAAISALDLVIACDTAIAHLAGALAIPVWVALPAVPDWRWLLDRDDSPWYPTARLFRQQTRGEWAPVFDRIAEALAGL